MKYLLDTHTFLWFMTDAPELSQGARDIIESESEEAYINIASIWEIAIKVSSGKLELDFPFDELEEELRLNQIWVLGITFQHMVQVATLPFHHRDPFDRLIIAQSLVESMPIIGVDAVFDAYGVTRLW